MVELLQSLPSSGGSLTIVCLLFLPVVFQLFVTAIYTVAEAIWRFRKRRGLF